MSGIRGAQDYTAEQMGSIAVAGWIAYVAFWLLLVYGWAVDELHTPTIAIFLILWIAARFGLPYLDAGAFFITAVAVLDIALVFLIFKGDIPLT
jgi:hypothetical protein